MRKLSALNQATSLRSICSYSIQSFQPSLLLDLSSAAVGRLGEIAIPVLQKKLGGFSEDLDGRWKVLNAYGRMGKCVIPWLIKFLEDETYPFYKDRAAGMLREIAKREYGVTLNYGPKYDDSYAKMKEEIGKWKKWWQEHEND